MLQILQIVRKTATSTTNRNFWTYGIANSIGYIESQCKVGFLFPTHYIMFRETSSNFASNSVVPISTEHLTAYQAEDIKKLMLNKTPVSINYKLELLSSPLKGDIWGGLYLLNVIKLNEEIVTIDSKK